MRVCLWFESSASALKLRSWCALEYPSWPAWWSCDQACCWRWRAVEAVCVVSAAAMKAKREHQRSWYKLFYSSYLFPNAKRPVEWNVSSFWSCKLCFICCSPPKQPDVNLVYINNEFSDQTKRAESSTTQQTTEFMCVINEHDTVTVSESSVLPI